MSAICNKSLSSATDSEPTFSVGTSALLGAFCIPLYIPYILTGKWPFGRGLCKLWLVVDYLMCTASVFNIVLISYDRFLSVTKAVSYRINPGMTSKAIAMMVAIWVFAFLLYGPAIIIWEYVVGCSIVPDKKCYAEFIYNWHLLLGSSIFEFFTPLILVAYFNIQIFRSIQNRLTTIPQELSESPKSKSQVRRLWCLLKEDASFSDSETEKSCSTSGSQRHLSTSDRPRPSHLYSHTSETDPMGSFKVKTSRKLQRDKKIAKSLAIIVCIFVICWAPYSLLIIIFAACDGNCIKPYLYEISFWLLWLNSSVNPFLYPLCHVKFRNAFRKILCPYKRAESSPRPSVSF
ncbi:histamine H3 receptor-like isoform X1 [Alligator sinensis]|uniref:Histamine H3 receptor-like isoform X1 n=1 Tax=Alligator sinensis TaxID=38654 RepID=A0A3Q0HDJ5_ALLSI|nr:histamine H3 receptor-like isoform X1 [Alligator sinensis]